MTDTKKTFVTMGIAAYNVREDFLRSCIESVIKNSDECTQIIIVDDCSNESTAKICRGYNESDSRILYIRHEENKGIGAVRNTIIKNASGKHLLFIDGDDMTKAQYFVSASQASQIVNNYDAGFLNFQPMLLNLQISIQGLIMKIIMVLANVVVIARLFELTVYTLIAPVPLSTFACEGLSDVGKGFLKSYAAVSLQAIVLAIMFVAYSAVNTALVSGRIGSTNLTLNGVMGLVTTLTLAMGVMQSGSWSKKICGAM